MGLLEVLYLEVLMLEPDMQLLKKKGKRNQMMKVIIPETLLLVIHLQVTLMLEIHHKVEVLVVMEEV